MRILRPDSAGKDVLAWQEFLRSQGFDPGPSDGLFQARTKQATIAFQSAHSLTPDGIVGNQTFTKAMMLGFKPLPDVDARTNQEIAALVDGALARLTPDQILAITN